MRNTITLHLGCTGLEFKNPTSGKFQPIDRETAGLFVRNVLNYPKLRVGPEVFQKSRGKRAGK